MSEQTLSLGIIGTGGIAQMHADGLRGAGDRFGIRAACDPDEGTSVRCAIYTRKSSEDGLEQEFNSLDAQRGPSRTSPARSTKAGWRCRTAMMTAASPAATWTARPRRGLPLSVAEDLTVAG